MQRASLLLRRGLAKKASKAAPAARVLPPPEGLTHIVNGLNILKDGSDPPIKDDSEYPDWVWTLHKPLPKLDELEQRYAADPDAMNEMDTRRLIRQWNRKRIKDRNALLKK